MRPRWRGRLHAAAAAAAIPLGALLIAAAQGTAATITAAIYVVSLVAAYATSASYHLLARTLRSQQLMQRADHAMIFVLIAGSATPIFLLSMSRPWGTALLTCTWIAALCGVLLKVAGRAARRVVTLYLMVSWTTALSVPSLVRHSDLVTVGLVVAGGALYTVGAVLFAANRPKLRPEVFGYHEVWHLFTIAAGAAHFIAISRLAA